MSTTHATPPQLEPEANARLQALQREVDQLRTALATRIVIEQAKGMLAERLDCHVDEAFERLRRETRNRRIKLHRAAAAVVAREAWADSLFGSAVQGNETARARTDAR